MKKTSLTFILLLCILHFLTGQNTEIIGGREFIVHQVLKGETVYGIAKKYDVLQDTILAYNKSASTGVKVDQVLKFPSKNSAFQSNHLTSNQIKHVVVQGETLYGIAKKYGVTIAEIEKLNPQIINGAIKIDEIILIPVKSNNNEENNDPKNNTNHDGNQNTNTNDNSSAGIELVNCDTFKIQNRNYKIALILPFKGNNYASSKIATEFYYGFKVAVDSVSSKMKVGVKIYVMNSSAVNDSDKIEEKYDFEKLKGMDLIIGPLYSANIRPVAEFAMENKIPIVSPFTKSTSLLEGNPYAIKITPSDFSLAKRTLDYFNNTYPGCNFILVKATKGVGRDSLLHAAYSIALDSMGITDTNRIHKVKGNPSAYFKGAASRNVVIYMNSREVNVKAFITGFNKAHKGNKISLVGTENWLEFNNVEADYYMNLNLHIPVATYADFTDSTGYDYFIRRYQYAVKADPTDYSFKGYKIGSDFMRRFFTYGGNICQCVNSYKETDVEEKLPFNFNFVRKSDQDGWENNAIQILRVQEDYKLEIINY